MTLFDSTQELISIKNKIQKNIEDYRFDEAAKMPTNLHGIHIVIGTSNFLKQFFILRIKRQKKR